MIVLSNFSKVKEQTSTYVWRTEPVFYLCQNGHESIVQHSISNGVHINFVLRERSQSSVYGLPKADHQKLIDICLYKIGETISLACFGVFFG